MPYSAVAPRLVSPEVGLHHLVARAGHNAAYEIDVTLLDAPDHRLIRSGVLLAHRVLDGRGEWYLSAPDWRPLLPEDRVELMGHADLPEELADLIRPLRRRAPLGPVAALECDRREFALRDGEGTTRALLRDDRVTVRRGGLTTARYREVMVTPVGPGLTEDQDAFVQRALLGAGSTPVAGFPRLAARLGAPATAPSDVPVMGPIDPGGSFRRFVSQVLGRRLRSLVEVDLAVRGGSSDAVGRLLTEVKGLRGELAGLGLAVDAEWRSDLVDELGWLVGDGGPVEDRLRLRLRSERYLALLDQLVAAARAPKLGHLGSEPASEVLATLLRRALDRVSAAVRAVEGRPDVDGAAWTAVVTAFTDAEATARLAGLLPLPAAAKVQARLEAPARRLAEVGDRPPDEAEALAAVAEGSSADAFAAGRDLERRSAAWTRSRAEFLRTWARAERKLARQVQR